MVAFYGFHVGKYTSPMDPIWVMGDFRVPTFITNHRMIDVMIVYLP